MAVADLVQDIVDLLNANKKALGLSHVFYGDQEKVFGQFVACIEPGQKECELHSANRRVRVGLEVIIYVYSSSIKDPSSTRPKVDKLTDDIEKLLNDSVDFSGKVIHSYVRQVRYGYATKADGLVHSNEITLYCMYDEQLRNIL